ncbi:hypothetical protein K0M31_008878 [Melipona bicolor]|uniref:Uncharacterized protein n=1 Tax=Melipona bicolor TaxID=60889 RepID=A0AA40FQ32_9HYME|nr:hypothetical protein K0M31_008878 [Melipona bicolor]
MRKYGKVEQVLGKRGKKEVRYMRGGTWHDGTPHERMQESGLEDWDRGGADWKKR